MPLLMRPHLSTACKLDLSGLAGGTQNRSVNVDMKLLNFWQFLFSSWLINILEHFMPTKIFLSRNIPFRVYYNHENTLDCSGGSKPRTYCRDVARWPTDCRRDHPAAGNTATAGIEAPQGVERGCHCGGPAAGQPENLPLKARTLPGVGGLAAIFSSPLGGTLRSPRQLPARNTSHRATTWPWK